MLRGNKMRISFIFFLALATSLIQQDSRAQETSEPPITITVSGESRSSALHYLNGYREEISGQTITYHSSHPDVEDALLCRVNREADSIAWRSDTLPVSYPGDYYRFVWLSGLERIGWGNATHPHNFTFFVNGVKWFSFTNRKDSSAPKWTVTGPEGAELSFESHFTDKFGDLFGMMFLKLPKNKFQSGNPLIFSVRGEDADSPEWYMAFKYRFSFVPGIRVEPALIRQNKSVSGLLRISLDDLDEGRSIEISSSQFPTLKENLHIGGNIFFVPVDGVTGEKTQPLKFSGPGMELSSSVVLKPVKHRDIYLLSHTHNDIGYTDLQPNVEKKQWWNLEEALRLIDKTKEYPADSKYKWNMEILWPLESYLQQATQEKRDQVITAIRNGSIGLNALFVNPLTGLATAPEMGHFTDYARRFTRDYGIPITTAAVSDVPGFTWGMVPMLAQSGVKYFASAPNNGDRIGYIIEQLGDKPFYWNSQSGKEKILFWVAGSSYSSFHEGSLGNLGPEKIMKLVRRLDQQGYPYEMYYLPYTLGDNGSPDSTLSDVVRDWNEKYVTPHLVISTHREMFEKFEEQYGKTLPTLKGDLTPYWEDGAASTAFETALNRHVVDHLTESEALWSRCKPESFPDSAFYSAWREVVLWDEHTWGADKSVTDPDDPGVIGQWNIKKGYVLRADSLSGVLRGKVIGRPGPGKRRTAIDVFNTNSWPRTDMIFLSKEQSGIGDRVTDVNGKQIPSQRLRTGELAVLVRDVPPISAMRIFVQRGKAWSEGDVNDSGSDRLENKFLILKVDDKTGAISSIIWKERVTELVDTSRGTMLNRYIYIPGTDPDSARYLSNVSVSRKESGKLVSSLVIRGEAPGCRNFSTELRIYAGLPRVDIIDDLDKMAVRTKEGVHFAFPFLIPEGRVRYDVADAVVEPEKDQLPGSCENFFSVASWVDVSNDRFGVSLSTPDVPLIEIGRITAEAPWMKSISPSQRIYSYAMNNYWHTNYKADQSGPVRFRYSILAHGGFDPVDAVKFGMERRQPLIAAVVDASRPTLSSLFTLDPSSVVVESVRPLDSGHSWLLSLYNPASADANVRISWKGGGDVGVCVSDLSGRLGDSIGREFTLPAHDAMIVRVGTK